MKNKDLHRLGKTDLLEIIYEQKNEIDNLKSKVDELNKQLDDRTIKLKEAGNIAEASIKINELFETAQKVADEYIANVKKQQETELNNNEKISKEETIEQSTLNKIDQISKDLIIVHKSIKSKEDKFIIRFLKKFILYLKSIKFHFKIILKNIHLIIARSLKRIKDFFNTQKVKSKQNKLNKHNVKIRKKAQKTRKKNSKKRRAEKKKLEKEKNKKKKLAKKAKKKEEKKKLRARKKREKERLKKEKLIKKNEKLNSKKEKQNNKKQELNNKKNKDNTQNTKKEISLKISAKDYKITKEDVEKELNRRKKIEARRKFINTLIYSIIVIIAIAIILASRVFYILQVSGNSMEPTLYAGDLLLTSKLFNYKKGDVIAFYYNDNILIKRLIATEGDIVNIDDEGNVYVNSQKLDEKYIEELSYEDCDITLPYQVPSGTLFVLGDNRKHSVDSRNKSLGVINVDRIIGKILIRFNRFSFL